MAEGDRVTGDDSGKDYRSTDGQRYGQLAYDAYGASVDYVNYQGLPMPAWSELTPAIRVAWIDAANVVRVEAMANNV